MRPEPRETGLGCAGILLFAAISAVVYFTDDKPRKDYIKEQTKPVLNQAHKEAINSVDTLDLTKYFIDVKSARKDSARMTEHMQKWMDNMSERQRFNDYTQDDTVGFDMGNGRRGYRLTPHFSINKAMKDANFANTYNQYVNAIKQLEIARRQGKNK